MRSVEPVIVSRFNITGIRSISTLLPLRKAICTSRPSRAREAMSRAT
jgi:hypothetical protein